MSKRAEQLDAAIEALWQELEATPADAFEKRCFALTWTWARERGWFSARWSERGRAFVLVSPDRQLPEIEERRDLIISALVDHQRPYPRADNATSSGVCVARGGLLLCHGLAALSDAGAGRTRSLALLLERRLQGQPTADEERRQQGLNRLQRAAAVIAEAGGAPIDGGPFTLCPITTAQKTATWFRVCALNPGEAPGYRRGPSAVDRLVRGLERVRSYRHPLRPTEATSALLQRATERARSPLKQHLEGLADPSRFDETALEMGAAGDFFRAILSDTWSITQLTGPGRLDATGARATATLDCRTMPGGQTKALSDLLHEVLGPDLQLELLGERRGKESPIHGELMRCMREAIARHWPAALCAPTLQTMNADSWGWRQQALPCYGFTPVDVAPQVDPIGAWLTGGLRCDEGQRAKGRKCFVDAIEAFTGGAI